MSQVWTGGVVYFALYAALSLLLHDPITVDRAGLPMVGLLVLSMAADRWLGAENRVAEAAIAILSVGGAVAMVTAVAIFG